MSSSKTHALQGQSGTRLVGRVVVCADAGVVELLETHDDRVADAALRSAPGTGLRRRARCDLTDHQQRCARAWSTDTTLPTSLYQ